MGRYLQGSRESTVVPSKRRWPPDPRASNGGECIFGFFFASASDWWAMLRARNLLWLGTETLSSMVGVITDSLTRCAAWARYADLVMNSGSFSWVTHVSEKCFSTSLKYPSTVIKVGGYQLLTCFLCRCSLIMTCSGWKAYPWKEVLLSWLGSKKSITVTLV